MIIYLFWISIIFVIYTYLLYPLLIILASKMIERPPVSEIAGENHPSITIIIIAFNEENVILEKVENLGKLDYPREKLRICIVSDGSNDGTNEILENQGDILFIKDDENRGKPHQINTAVRLCKSDLIVFSDARQIYKSDALLKLARNFADPEIGAVSGELVFGSAKASTERSVGLYWKYEKALRIAESRVDSTLGATGAIYAIRRNLVEPIPQDTILDDIEIPLSAFRRGYRVTFDGEAIAYDTASDRIATEFRRKVRTLTGNFQLFERNLWLLNPLENRIFWQSTSHKLFRLVVPYFMLIALVTSFLHGSVTLRSLFGLQLVLYGLGVLGLVSSWSKNISLINFLTVFLSLNAASVYALIKHSMGKQDARWKN